MSKNYRMAPGFRLISILYLLLSEINLVGAFMAQFFHRIHPAPYPPVLHRILASQKTKKFPEVSIQTAKFGFSGIIFTLVSIFLGFVRIERIFQTIFPQVAYIPPVAHFCSYFGGPYLKTVGFNPTRFFSLLICDPLLCSKMKWHKNLSTG